MSHVAAVCPDTAHCIDPQCYAERTAPFAVAAHEAPTMAQSLAALNARRDQQTPDFNSLWDQVDGVERMADGSDLYTYPDGSRLKVSSAGVTVVNPNPAA